MTQGDTPLLNTAAVRYILTAAYLSDEHTGSKIAHHNTAVPSIACTSTLQTNMPILDLLHFDSDAYRWTISQPAYSYVELATNIYKMRRTIAGSMTAAFASAAAAVFTHGLSLLGSAYAIRKVSVAEQKLLLLEAEWTRRGQLPLPRRRFRDVVIPVVIASTVGTFAFTIDLGMTGISDAATQVVTETFPGSVNEVNGHVVNAYYSTLERNFEATANGGTEPFL